MSCPRLAAPLLLALALASGPAMADVLAQATSPPAPSAPAQPMPPTAPPLMGPAAPSPLQPGDAFGER